MIRIDKLSLSGIRAFCRERHGPDDPNVIVFDSSLTVILGPNGAGKTTVIEALRNATSGLFPNHSCGKSWLSHPELCGVGGLQRSSEGCVTLSFSRHTGSADDSTAEHFVLTRTYKLKVVRHKMTLSTDRCELTCSTVDGRTSKVKTYSATEAKEEIPKILGVHQSLLDFVLFCPKDDSEWPLADKAEVKKRFDSLFRSTRYSRMIQELVKQSKEVHHRGVVKAAELAAVAKDKCAAGTLSLQVKKCDGDLSAAQKGEKLAQAKAKQLSDIQEFVTKLVSDCRSLDRRCSIERKNANDLKKKLAALEKACKQISSDQVITESDISVLSQQCDALATQKMQFESQKSQLSKQVASLRDASRDSVYQKQQLDGQIEAATARQAKSRETILDHASKLSLQAPLLDTGSWVEELSRFRACAEEASQTRIKEADATLDAATARAEFAVDALRDAEVRNKEAENAVADCASSLKAKLQEFTAIDKRMKELSAMDTSASRRLELQAEQSNLSEQLTGLDAEFGNLSSRLNALRSTHQALQDESKRRGSLFPAEMKLKMLKERCTTLTLEFTRQLEAMMKPEVRRVLDDIRGEGNVDVAKSTPLERYKALSALAKAQVLRCERSGTNLQDRHATLEGSLRQETTRRNAIDESIRETTARLLQAGFSQNDIDTYHSSKDVRQHCQTYLTAVQTFHKFREKSEEDRALSRVLCNFSDKAKAGQGCPLCRRKFEDESLHTEFLQQLELRCAATQDEKRAGKRKDKLQAAQEVVQNMDGCLSIFDDLQIKHKEASDQNDRLCKLSKQLDDLSKNLEESREEQKRWAARVGTLDSVAAAFESGLAAETEIGKLKVQIVAAEKVVEDETNRLPPPLPSQGVSEEQIEKYAKFSSEELTEGTTTTSAELSAVTTKFMALSETRRECQSEFEKLGKELADCGGSSDELGLLAPQHAQLKSALAELKKNQPQLASNLKAAKSEVETADVELKACRSSIRQETQNATAGKLLATEQLRLILAAIEDFQKATNELSELNTAYHSCADGLASKLEEIKTLEHSVTEKALCIEQTEDQLDKLTPRLKLMKDKFDLSGEINELESAARRTEGQIYSKIEAMPSEYRGVLNVDASWPLKSIPIEDALDELVNSVQNAMQESKMEIGALMQEVKSLRAQSKELSRQFSGYVGIDQKFATAAIEVATHRALAAELKAHADALAKSVVRYHDGLLSRLNDDIRELWQRTYRGPDIDGIEIFHSNPIEGEADLEKITQRAKSYEYRVVMYRSGVQMDMRGHASTGQKVLACIVIRLALAQVFNLPLGMLALDEPTANLDEENARALAVALRSVLQPHASSFKFQLVVVTHDAAFVRALAELSPGELETFWYVDREARALGECRTVSSLYRRSIADLSVM